MNFRPTVLAALLPVLAACGGEIYHLKAAGEQNWNKPESVFAMAESASACC